MGHPSFGLSPCKRAIGRRKINLLRLRSTGKELVKLYRDVVGKGIEDLEAEPKHSYSEQK